MLNISITETQIKTTMNYYLTTVKTAIKNTRNKKCWTEYVEKETHICCRGFCKLLVQSLWKTVQRCLKKLRLKLPYDPAISLLGIYPKNTKILIWKDTWISMFTAALSTIAKTWKQPKFLSVIKGPRRRGCVCVWDRERESVCVCVCVCINYTQWNTIQP